MSKLNTKKLVSWSSAVAVVAIVLAPVAASAATDTGSTTINSTVGNTISMTTSGTLAVNVMPTTSAVESVYDDVVTISTNNATGYTLALADSDAITTLASGGNSIAAHAGTAGTPTLLADNTWGWRVDNSDGVGTEFPLDAFGAGPTVDTANSTTGTGIYAGMPTSASPVTVRSTTTTASGQVTNVWYGVRINTAQPTGTYTGAVTYTATTK